eukprot:CAMPEP_0179449116 /NCGR_PEP_ID=MMETSP0799-20121207/33105_1 /TAXON_ID=46947 /ORGANISM="Geminigera cryophila, Strain CCMP2564" /LENGTH=45 /DNA_ID= /DNA_START= /DNA_END= /DNA_ORIENTATION=
MSSKQKPPPAAPRISGLGAGLMPAMAKTPAIPPPLLAAPPLPLFF